MKYNKKMQRKKCIHLQVISARQARSFLKGVQHIELANHFLKSLSDQTAAYENEKVKWAN